MALSIEERAALIPGVVGRNGNGNGGNGSGQDDQS
jgi:hypothetical protein